MPPISTGEMALYTPFGNAAREVVEPGLGILDGRLIIVVVVSLERFGNRSYGFSTMMVPAKLGRAYVPIAVETAVTIAVVQRKRK